MKINEDLIIGETNKSLKTISSEIDELKPVILFDSNGETGDITLLDDPKKYALIKVYVRQGITINVLPAIDTGFQIYNVGYDPWGEVLAVKQYTISGNTFTVSHIRTVYISNSSIGYNREDRNQDMWRTAITKVVGYKTII